MHNPHPSLLNQTVVVLGGASGIGAAVARQARDRGARVIVASRQPGPVGEGIEAVTLDITDTGALHALFADIGTVDHLVISAGPAVQAKPLAQSDLQQAREAFEVKFWGALQTVQAALPYLSPRASISLTSGLLSRKFVPGQLIKTTLNAALEALGKQLAKELAPRRVNVISPGLTDTEAYAAMDTAQRVAMFDRAAAGLPVGRVGQADEVAAGFILAMENGFMTGSIVDIDGGGLL
ncbi:SDR family oxidoreductase [Pseudomonas donghuensis]|uniref:SDR family oxidoreductase n=1 Tax=Pseudomonas donghuensis TaxID=1163398 RepID=A0AAP0SEN6_9PSED|nr:SDR family oxidoreductase [Pseudomonas donghuensis]KDN99025.2 SDR family oxidoreductase [Pseudomonas donghuensis]MCP6691230.1 SDR family oxidoreductase [Pseudomonas donghuensis]MDF9893333.1 NAD(P)-dependent dehydrogenase (short-subunit alcohol dehydrogenase family) [Pseudomonas vranovensis]